MRTVLLLIPGLVLAAACLDDEWSISEEEQATETATPCRKKIFVHFAVYGFMQDPKQQTAGDGRVDLNLCWNYERPQQNSAFTCGPAMYPKKNPIDEYGIGWSGYPQNWHSWIYEDTAFWQGHEQEASKVRKCSELAGGAPGGTPGLKRGIEYMAPHYPSGRYHDGANTIERCTAACQAAGYSYAGLQYGSECFCDDNYGNYGKSTVCNMTCSGNAGEICGGNWANSVYRTTEMLAGGGFEGSLADWRALEASLDTAEKKVGASSLRLTHAAASGWMIASQDILARPGKRYAVTGWLRTRNARQTHLKIDWFKSDGTEVDPTRPDFIAVLVDGTTDWTRFSRQVTAPPTASYGTLSLLGGWSADGAGPADTWWDEIEVEVVQRNAFPDLDGDGKTDVVVWRPVNGAWYVKDGVTTYWGLSGDIPVPGDYDGDGRTDVAVWRPSSGTWYVKDKLIVQWGLRGDIPVPGDYNGDGKTDLAFWRAADGGWYVKDVAITPWGTIGDIPVPADYNGDGKTDIAVWRPSTGTWYVRNLLTQQWGDGPIGDVPAPSDHTGDGRAGLVVYRQTQGAWWIRDHLGTFYPIAWGAAGGDHPIRQLAGGTPPNAAATLAPGESLTAGQTRRSSDGRFLLQYQSDGNLVLYQESGGQFTALWNSGTWGTSPGRALMQHDGNLVILNGADQAIWSTGTYNNAGARLVVRSDGSAAVISASSAVLWSTGTCCR